MKEGGFLHLKKLIDSCEVNEKSLYACQSCYEALSTESYRDLSNLKYSVRFGLQNFSNENRMWTGVQNLK